MSTLPVPYFHSATIPAPPPALAPFADTTPWREILAVEPDIALRHAKSRLLAQANYRVTWATGERELFTLRDAKPVPLAILSDHLGPRLLGTVAGTIRRRWPRTRILVLGESVMGLEDYLYDEHIFRSPDPQRVLDDLEMLYNGMWNHRSHSIDWNAIKAGHRFTRPAISESDPTKMAHRASAPYQYARDTPSYIRARMPRRY